jgi:LacI family transcriptional regulator
MRLRLRVPEDVAVIGVGNTLDGERMEPSLSSVGPTDFFPRLAKILRDRAIGDPPAGGTLYDFSWSLFARESTLGQVAPSAS